MEEKINNILNEIKDAKLIAVSKTIDVDVIKKVYYLGIRDFGENKVQELIKKQKQLPKDIRWHMIGHLQTNKVKDIIDKVYLIHSVDSVKLAKEINRQAIKKDIIVNILLEINVAKEEFKYGFYIEDIDNAIKEISTLKNIIIKGFMTVAPYTTNPIENKKYFHILRELKEKYSFEILSMGMSNDYLVAVEEKSNYVRIGTKIFGERNYKKLN